MSHFAFLAPVGPFAGLSDPAREKIAQHYPRLSITAIDCAAASFLLELEARTIEPRLAEARDELNIFAKELARVHAALNHIRKHRLDNVIGEASRKISGENQFDDLERCLNNLRRAIQQTSRSLPFTAPELASRRLIERLAKQMTQAGLALTGSNSLHMLVDLIFEDLMVGGDAESAITDWQKSEAADLDDKRGNLLVDLVIS